MLWDWLGPARRSQERAGRHVLFYTRNGCHLCERRGRSSRRRKQRYGFTLERTDVEADSRLAAEHGECVPVVVIDGKVRFRGRVNSVLLERILG